VLVDRVGRAQIHEIVDARVLGGLFVVAVALGLPCCSHPMRLRVRARC
jgi:hypothetical protein